MKVRSSSPLAAATTANLLVVPKIESRPALDRFNTKHIVA